MRLVFIRKNLVPLVFIAAGLYLLRETYAERVVFYASPDELGPMTYPRYLLWGWLVLSFLYLIFPKKQGDAAGIRASLPMLSWAAASMGAYYLLFRYGGLFESTFLFLLMFFYILHYRDPKKMLAISFSTAFIVWLVFQKLLVVPMPVGIIERLFG